jgi:hypothetical protein
MADAEVALSVSKFVVVVVNTPFVKVNTPEIDLAPLKVTPALLLIVKLAGVLAVNPFPVT